MFIIQVLNFYKVRGERTALLRSQPWAEEGTLQTAVANTIRTIKSQVRGGGIATVSVSLCTNQRGNESIANKIRSKSAILCGKEHIRVTI